MRNDTGPVAEAEARVARERLLLSAEVALWREHALDRVASLRGLGAAAGIGFVLGTVLLHRPRKAPEPSARKGMLAAVAGLALTGLRLRYGTPMAAVPQLLDWARSRAGRTARTGYRATPPSSPPPSPISPSPS